MSNSLFLHEQIKTTLPKAKDLRSIVEKFITMAKNSEGSLHVRRVLLSRLNNNEEVVSKLLTSLSDRYKNRAGGYTRVVKAGYRHGDCAPMAVIELVDRPSKNTAITSPLEGVVDQKVTEAEIVSKPKKTSSPKTPAKNKAELKKD